MYALVGVSAFLWILWFIIFILVAVWVYRDAQKRYPKDSSMPVIWLLIVLLTGLIGLIVYLIVRPQEREEQQPSPYGPPPTSPQY